MKRRVHGIVLFLVVACGLNDSEPKPLIFFVIGDWGRNGSPNQTVVANQMNEWAKMEDPAFIVSTGDNFYDVGVTGIEDKHWQNSFEKVYNGDRIKAKSWYISLGNHDYLGRPEAEIEYHTTNSRWNLPDRYYTKIFVLPDGGKMRLIVVDTSPLEKTYYTASGLKEKVSAQDTTRQKRWLDSLTRMNDVNWKVVIGHHHVYTSGARRNDPNSVRNSLEPIFTKNAVDVYFCGHEHDLQYMKPLQKPTHYFLSGAGSDLRPTGKIPETVFSASVQGFMSVQAWQRKLIVKIIDYKGNELFAQHLEK